VVGFTTGSIVVVPGGKNNKKNSDMRWRRRNNDNPLLSYITKPFLNYIPLISEVWQCNTRQTGVFVTAKQVLKNNVTNILILTNTDQSALMLMLVHKDKLQGYLQIF
jgi:hypothetical protein